MSVAQLSYLGRVAARATASDRALLQPSRFVEMPMVAPVELAKVEPVAVRDDRSPTPTSTPTAAPTAHAPSPAPVRRNAETVPAQPLAELARRAAVMPSEEAARAPRVEPGGTAWPSREPPVPSVVLDVAPSSSAPRATRHAGERSSLPFALPQPEQPREAVHRALLSAFSWTATPSHVAPAPPLPTAPLAAAPQPAPARVAVTEGAARGAAPAVIDGKRTTAVASVHAGSTLAASTRAATPRAAFEPRAPEVRIGSIEVELVSPPVSPPPAPRSAARAPAAPPARLARDFSSCFGFRQS